MRTSTQSVELAAPKEKVFGFLSRMENLPKWATLFCRELKRDGRGGWRVVTPDGEICFAIKSDPETGVIDMYGGPTEEAMAHWPTRVVAVSGARSIFLFTAIQYPGITDDDFAAQCQGLEEEFQQIKA